MTGELIRYDEMCRAIEAAHSVDEVLPIRDRAAQIAAVAKVARNFEAERQCREIRVRAERKVGELLAEMPKIVGDVRNPQNAETEPKGKSLANFGISTQEASEWQRLAAVPEAEFESTLRTSDAPSGRGIIYDYKRLQASEPAVAGRTLTAEDFENAVLEGVIKDLQWLENKYNHIEFVKNALANLRRTASARLKPKPAERGSGIRVVK